VKNRKGKKEVEQWVVNAAREAGIPLPIGELPGEEPDFRFLNERPPLGLEVTELVRPASSNQGIIPTEQQSFHDQIMGAAQHRYCNIANAKPVHVSVYFTDARGARQNREQLIKGLVDRVLASAHKANPYFVEDKHDLPKGFDHIGIVAEERDWWSGECGGISLDEIPREIEARISAKNKLVPMYRANLPQGAEVWLLIYSLPTVARNVPIRYGIGQQQFAFEFDRVFWFDCLERCGGEITRA
jgi:hypothetical protein